jgi:hypothetical protein
MSRENRNLAGFSQVADVSPKINNNNNEKNSVNDSQSKEMDVLDKVLDDKTKKSKTMKLKGIYFENDVARAIDRVTRGRGKGAKSELINAIVKMVFKQKNWM